MARNASCALNIEDAQRRHALPTRDGLRRYADQSGENVPATGICDCPYKGWVAICPSHTQVKPRLRGKVKRCFIYSIKQSLILPAMFKDRLKRARTEARPKITQADVGGALGVSPQAVSGWERGENMPEPDKLPKLAKMVGKSVDWLLEGDVAQLKQPASSLSAINGEHDMAAIPKNIPATIPGGVLVGNKDLPVHASAQGGRGSLVVSSDPIDWVSRPEPLARVKDGYGIIVSEDSMSPEFESGDIALVHPHMPPIVGRSCVFYCEAADGTITACIKRLRKETADAWHVRQFSPRRDYQMKKTEWQKCHVTVGSYKGR